MCMCVSAMCLYPTEAQPDYSDHYYGFTQYAIELNELTDDLAKHLPICDTRFRPDQRYMVCNDVGYFHTVTINKHKLL